MKKLLAFILSLLMVASCFALAAVAAEETTASEETTAAEGETTAAGEETTEAEAKDFVNTKLVFNSDAQGMKLLNGQNGINKAFYNSAWEGAMLKITKPEDPYVYLNWANYCKKADLEQLDSQSYPFVVIKLKVEGYIDDIELFYCAGEISGADPAYATTTDLPCDCTGEVEYIIYDLTGDCEGNYNQFRIDPMGADEDTIIYLYEVAMFATWEEAEAYAGIEETEAPETEAPTAAETEEETEAETQAETKKPAAEKPEEKKGCGSVVSIGAVVAIIALGVVCIKKKD